MAGAAPTTAELMAIIDNFQAQVAVLQAAAPAGMVQANVEQKLEISNIL